MTNLCGGGASQLKPGSGQTVVFSAGLITEGLAAIDPFLIPFALLIDAFSYQATSQCQADPPPMPTSDQLNPINAVGGVFNPNFENWKTAVNNLLLNWAWNQFCECTSGPQPTFSWPPAPSTSTTPNAPVGNYCSDLQLSQLAEQQADFPPTGTIPTVNNVLLPYQTFANEVSGSQTLSASVIAGPVPTQLIIKVNYVSGGVGNEKAEPGLVAWDASGNQVVNQGPFYVWSGQTSNGATINLPSNTHAIAITNPSTNTPSTIHDTIEVLLVCSGVTPGAPSGCCPPDPTISTALANISVMLQSIYQSINPPLSSYAEGTVHSNLSGSGSILLNGSCLAVKVAITTDVPNGRVDQGDPSYLFDRGYIVPIALEGPLRVASRLVYNPQLFQLPQLTDSIGYTLPAGEVISITELTRGP